MTTAILLPWEPSYGPLTVRIVVTALKISQKAYDVFKVKQTLIQTLIIVVCCEPLRPNFFGF